MKRLWIISVALLLIYALQSCGIRPVTFASPLPAPLENKRGVGTNDIQDICIPATCADVANLGVGWTFKWYVTALNCSGIESVCQISVPLANNYCEILRGTSQWLMGFNEPELPASHGQANLTPTQGAIAWKDVEGCYPDKFLISPAIVVYDNKLIEGGTCCWADTMVNPTCRWLEDWRTEYIRLYNRHPRIDALGGHCYAQFAVNNDTLTACRTMTAYLEARLKAWNIQGGIWMNEFGPIPSTNQDEMNRQLLETMFYFERTPTIARYAAWAPCRALAYPSMSMFGCDNHTLTSYGAVYKSQVHTAFMPMINR